MSLSPDLSNKTAYSYRLNVTLAGMALFTGTTVTQKIFCYDPIDKPYTISKRVPSHPAVWGDFEPSTNMHLTITYKA